MKAILILCGLLISALAACTPPPPLTEREEYFVGRAVSANLLGTYTLDKKHTEMLDYLYMVGLNLAEGSDRPNTYKGYHFAIMDHASVNAFAAPGGKIHITTGALKAMDNEDELAGVLAHEIAHVVLRHPEAAANAANQKRRAGEAVLAVGEWMWEQKNPGGDAAKWVALRAVFQGVIDDVVLEMIEKGYNREQEYEADRVGTEMLTRLGYDASALKDFLVRLEKAGTVGGSSGVLGWLGSTHPSPADRIQRLKAQLASVTSVPAGKEERRRRFQEKIATLK